MNCPCTSSEELLAFALDREQPDPAAQQHLAHCLACQSKVSAYQKIVTYLIPRLYRSSCPSAATLSYYCLPSVLPDGDRRQVAEHLTRCPRCACELAETRQFLGQR